VIDVIFTCKGRPHLTELCLRRLIELMPDPYRLTICYDDTGYTHYDMLRKVAPKAIIICRDEDDKSYFSLINQALEYSSGDLYMHTENDFYWQRRDCLLDAMTALEIYDDLDFIRFENLPFTDNTFTEYRALPSDKVGIMRKDSPYQFNFNPHLRRDKFPCGPRFKEDGFTKHDEQHFNDEYTGTSGCLFGDNFRHLGLYDEGGHYKPYYAERFTLRRGEGEIPTPLAEFDRFCSNVIYRQLFMRYLHEHKGRTG
jgi:hypothetical protein